MVEKINGYIVKCTLKEHSFELLFMTIISTFYCSTSQHTVIILRKYTHVQYIQVYFTTVQFKLCDLDK